MTEFQKIQKWRSDFEMKSELQPAIAMFKEEVSELLEAIELGNQSNIEKEFADVLFVVEQLREAIEVNSQDAVDRVLASNYTKRMTYPEFAHYFPDDCPYDVKLRSGYVYLYKNGKLQKPPTYKPA